MAKELLIKKVSGSFEDKETKEKVNYESLRITGFDGILDANITDKTWVKSVLKWKKDNPQETIIIKGQL